MYLDFVCWLNFIGGKGLYVIFFFREWIIFCFDIGGGLNILVLFWKVFIDFCKGSFNVIVVICFEVFIFIEKVWNFVCGVILLF